MMKSKTDSYLPKIEQAFDSNSQITGDNVVLDFTANTPNPKRLKGKVRDRYEGKDKLALVTTDRQSGFDRTLTKVPFKVSCRAFISLCVCVRERRSE